MEFNSASMQRVNTGALALFMEGAEAKPFYPPYMERIESSGYAERLVIPDGVGEMREWVGPREGKAPIIWDKLLVNRDWELTEYIPVNAFKDDRLGAYSGRLRLMGISAATHPDKLLAEVLIGGFTIDGYDGVPFFSDSHPKGEGVQGNLISGALSATTFREAMTALMSVTDYHGRPIRPQALGAEVHLMVGPSNVATARSIVAVPTTASGAGNPDFERAKVVVNDYFIGANAGCWMVVAAGGAVKPCILQVREEPNPQLVDDPQHPEVYNNKRVPVSVTGRWAAAAIFWQLAQGSRG